MALTKIQEEIVRALKALAEKSRFTEAILAKKIRELNNIDSKKKAGIALTDLEAAVDYMEADGSCHYALTVNNANEMLIERREESKALTAEAHQRRIRSEKSMTVLKNTDLSPKAKQGQAKEKHSAGQSDPRQKRTKREKLNIYGNWEE